MQEFILPIEQREENIDRAVEIVQAEADRSDEPATAMFMGAPIVALPEQRIQHTHVCWKTLFDQVQARNLEPVPAPQEQPQPETRERFPWHVFVGPAVILFLVVAIIWGQTIDRAVEGLFDGSSQVVTYDKNDASITLNYDAWKKKLGCAPKDLLNFSSTSVGSDHGNVSVKYVPFCDSGNIYIAPSN